MVVFQWHGLQSQLKDTLVFISVILNKTIHAEPEYFISQNNRLQTEKLAGMCSTAAAVEVRGPSRGAESSKGMHINCVGSDTQDEQHAAYPTSDRYSSLHLVRAVV